MHRRGTASLVCLLCACSPAAPTAMPPDDAGAPTTTPPDLSAPPPTFGALAELWRYTTHAMILDTVTDDAGNLYWIESAHDQRVDDLVSFDADGHLRFRVQVDSRTSIETFLAVGHGTVFVAADTWLLAFATSDGHALWSRDLGMPATDATFINAVTVTPDDRAVVTVAVYNFRAPDAHYVVALDGKGNPVWRRDVGWPFPSAADDDGSAYVPVDFGTLEAIAPDGQTRWTRSFVPDFTAGRWDAVAVAKGLVLAGDTLLSAADGQPAPVGVDRSAFAIIDWNALPAPLEPPAAGAFAYDFGPVVLADGTMLSSRETLTSFDDCAAALDLDTFVYPATSKTPLATYPLGRALAFDTGSVVAVQPGRIFVAVARDLAPCWSGDVESVIVALAAPGIAPATHGWVTWRGSPAHDGRAR